VDPTTAARRAIAHVRSLSVGQPLEPTLRVTLNFHPDREIDGTSMLEQVADSGS
jgi:hypothetical protein